VMMASMPKVSFWPDGITSLGNYGWLLVWFKKGWTGLIMSGCSDYESRGKRLILVIA
jgi:hypothetical protein